MDVLSAETTIPALAPLSGTLVLGQSGPGTTDLAPPGKCVKSSTRTCPAKLAGLTTMLVSPRSDVTIPSSLVSQSLDLLSTATLTSTVIRGLLKLIYYDHDGFH